MCIRDSYWPYLLHGICLNVRTEKYVKKKIGSRTVSVLAGQLLVLVFDKDIRVVKETRLR